MLTFETLGPEGSNHAWATKRYLAFHRLRYAQVALFIDFDETFDSRGTIYNEYEFVGYGLRSDDSRARMDEAVEILIGAWTTAPFAYEGAYWQVQLPELRPHPYQQPHPPLWRSVISPSSFTECGRLGIPLLTSQTAPHVARCTRKMHHIE